MDKTSTSKIQSEKILNNGISYKTADCYYETNGDIIMARDEYDLYIAVKMRHLTPSWTLLAILNCLPDIVNIENINYKLYFSKSNVYYMSNEMHIISYFEVSDSIDLYDCINSMIEWINIKNNK